MGTLHIARHSTAQQDVSLALCICIYSTWDPLSLRE